MWFDFTIACLLMGIAIGSDVAITTLLRAHSMIKPSQKLFWLIGVTATHTLFPMFGYLATYWGVNQFPNFTPIIGVVAFLLIMHFLKQELLSDDDDEVNEANTSNQLINFTLILAISWDALWSGPAKSAQVLNWSESLIWLSFVLVGIFVLFLAMASLKLAQKLQNKFLDNSAYLKVSLWLQYSIIFYFGLLALTRYSLALEVSTWQLFSLAGIFILLVMYAQQIQQVKLAAKVGP